MGNRGKYGMHPGKANRARMQHEEDQRALEAKQREEARLKQAARIRAGSDRRVQRVQERLEQPQVRPPVKVTYKRPKRIVDLSLVPDDTSTPAHRFQDTFGTPGISEEGDVWLDRDFGDSLNIGDKD